MKKFLALLLALVMILCMAGCAKEAAVPETEAEAVTEAAAETVSEGEPEEKRDVTLSLWHFKVAFDPGFQAAIEAFEQKTGIKVETEIVSDAAAYQQKVTAAATASSLPDIYLWWTGPTNGAFDGKAIDFSGELAADPVWADAFFPSALESNTISAGWLAEMEANPDSSEWSHARKEGEIFGIPLDVGSNYMIYANKQILTDAGIPAEAPENMEQWIEDIKTVKANTDKDALTVSMQVFSVYENWFVNFIDYMKNGPESFEKLMTGEEKMSDPQHIHIAQFLEDVAAADGYVAGINSLDIDSADMKFAEGKAAYAIGGTFTYANLSAMGMNMDDVISFRVPAYKDSVLPDAKIVPGALTSLCVSSEGAHVEEAVEFVKFITSEEGMIAYANGAYDIPSIKISDMSRLNPALAAMLASLSDESNWWSQNAVFINKIFEPQWQAFHESKQKVILGEMTAQQAAEKFDQDMAAELAKAE